MLVTTERRAARRNGWKLIHAAMAVLVMVVSRAEAGTITCKDQVGALRAKLVGQPDSSIRDKVDEAERLCRENRNAEALDLIRQARATLTTADAPSQGKR
jgi:hypothetical protein